jgi:surfactin synthase thioesterase subunit
MTIPITLLCLPFCGGSSISYGPWLLSAEREEALLAIRRAGRKKKKRKGR